MDLKKIQATRNSFEKERNWDKSLASNVFVHLIEELGEIGRYINFEEKYKDEKLGNSPNINRRELKREFAQAMMLFIQLANHYEIDLDEAIEKESKLIESRFKRVKFLKKVPT